MWIRGQSKHTGKDLMINLDHVIKISADMVGGTYVRVFHTKHGETYYLTKSTIRRVTDVYSQVLELRSDSDR